MRAKEGLAEIPSVNESISHSNITKQGASDTINHSKLQNLKSTKNSILNTDALDIAKFSNTIISDS